MMNLSNLNFFGVSGDIPCKYPFCHRKFRSWDKFASRALKQHMENPGNWHGKKGNINNNKTFKKENSNTRKLRKIFRTPGENRTHDPPSSSSDALTTEHKRLFILES